MNSPKGRRVPKIALLSFVLAGITLALQSPVKADAPSCRDGHACAVNGLPGQCAVGGAPQDQACWCFEVGGTHAEKEPACNTGGPGEEG